MDKNKHCKNDGVAADSQRKVATRNRGRFRKSEDGLAAVEFALVAPAFFGLIFAIMEIGINYWADRMLSTGLDTAARMVRTGQIRPSETYGTEQFRQAICDQPIMFLFDCDKLLVDVQEVAAFDENEWETDEDGNIKSDDFGFNPGGPSTINVVRAFYEWPTVLNWTAFGQAHGYQIDAFGEGSRVIAVSAAFLTEPFGSGSTGG